MTGSPAVTPYRPRNLGDRARRVLAGQPGAVVVFPPIPGSDDRPIADPGPEALSPSRDDVPVMPYSVRLEPGDVVWIGPDSGPTFRERFLFRIERIEAACWRGWVVLTGVRLDDESEHSLVVLAAGVDLWERQVVR